MYGPPDWVMCGMPLPDGRVRLLASKEMTHAELEAEFSRADPWDYMDLAPPVVSQRITLTSHMTTVVMIEAASYPDAFRALFEKWQPQPGQRAAIDGIPAIEAGPCDL